MTEDEWQASTDPVRMQAAIAESAFQTNGPDRTRTERKRILFGLACCRLVWPLIEVDERCSRMVEYQEDADGQRDDNVLEELRRGVEQAVERPADRKPLGRVTAAKLVNTLDSPGWVIGYLLRSLEGWGDVKQRNREVAHLLRCIVGNPFRPIVFDPNWRTETVVALASAIYAERAFDRMPILADALEEAGCDHVDILGHCRGSGPHARGCWVVDLVLDKQ